MPIQLEEYLNPISPDQPCGSDLRYAPVTDQIREARRQEDAIAQGVWKTDVKEADYLLVTKLARQALTKQGKDLQVAAWFTEALLARDGAPGLSQGIELIRRLLETYWDAVYPRVDEDGDLDMRATPLRWVASQLGPLVRSLPVTPSGVTWERYKDSRKVPTEEEANSNSEKSVRRQELLEDGKLSPEAFDKELENAPAAFYEQLLADIDAARQAVQDFRALCDEKFGDDGPDFGPLNTVLEEVRQTAHILCLKRGGNSPGQASGEEAEEEEAAPEPIGEDAAEASIEQELPQQRAAKPAKRRAPATAEPQDAADAVGRIADLAHYLRRQNIADPAPYLVLRALRWGELRAAGSSVDPSLAAAPDSATRVELKRISNECNWEQLIHTAEQAMAEPCGRAWLDLQRYLVRACRNFGLGPVADGVCSSLRNLLADYPELPDSTLADDTPAANAETKEWLKEENLLPVTEPPPAPEAPPPPPQMQWSPPPPPAPPADSAAAAAPDAYQLALEAAQSGQTDEAISLMLTEIQQEPSGRGRFLRRSQLVHICIATGNQAVALPILQELAAEIDQRKLDEWEAADVLSQPLGLLYGCLQSADGADPDKQRLYQRICRLDPLRAVHLTR